MFSIPPAGAPPGAPAATPASPVVQAPPAYGSGGAVSVATLQLPGAVVASGAVIAFSPNAPQAPKAPPRNAPTAASSSQLAAQVIGQNASLSQETLAVFTPPAPVTGAPTEADSYLADMRVALGDIPVAAKEPAAPPATNPAINNRSALPSNAVPVAVATNLPISLATNVIFSSGAAPLQARPAPTPLVPVGKKPGIGEARGSSAYKVASERNAALSFPATATAIL